MNNRQVTLQRQTLFRDTLKNVARSFYLTLRVLPASMREPVGLAYLLARAADTLADTAALPQSRRLHYLHCFRGYMTAPDSVGACDEIQTIVDQLPVPTAEARLLEYLPELFSLLSAQTEADRAEISQVVTTLTDGMMFDLQTFTTETGDEVTALQEEAQLDRYTWLVAGCVGEFWTDISMVHVTALSHWDRQRQSDLGIRFGKALQLTNILRDLPRDLRIGRCYLPQAWLSSHQLSVEELLDVTNSHRARPLLNQGVMLALQHYERASDYLLSIPRRCLRLRLAALWPLLIGLATLAKLSVSNDWLDANRTIKVERRWVYGMIFKSLFAVVSNRRLSAWINALRNAVTLSV